MSSRRRIDNRQVIQSLREMQDPNVVAIERTLRRIFNHYDALIPIPVYAVADRRRLDQCRSHD